MTHRIEKHTSAIKRSYTMKNKNIRRVNRPR